MARCCWGLVAGLGFECQGRSGQTGLDTKNHVLVWRGFFVVLAQQVTIGTNVPNDSPVAFGNLDLILSVRYEFTQCLRIVLVQQILYFF